MKVITTIIAEGKHAKLLLLDDTITVQVMYDNKIIFSSGKDTWKNIKDDLWAQKGVLKAAVEQYIRKQNAHTELQKITEEVFD